MPRPNLIDQPVTDWEAGAHPPFSSKQELVRYVCEKGGRAGRDISKRIALSNTSIWPDAAERSSD